MKAKIEPNTLYVNGVDGDTGRPLIEPIAIADAAAIIRSPEDNRATDMMRQRTERLTKGLSFGLPTDLDPGKLSDVGWAIVFAQDTPEAVRKELDPLIEHRRQQVPSKLFKILDYLPGESSVAWLERHHISIGDVDPETVPFFLLLIGGPMAIPFDVQYNLDVDYAVGRLAFPTAAEYGQYVKSVLAYESASQVPTQKQMVYWGPRHDGATTLSEGSLLRPLIEGVNGKTPVALNRGFAQTSLLAGDATKAALRAVLHGQGDRRPSLLFTASHGVGFRMGDARQLAGQGALVCQEAAEISWSEPECCLGGVDISDDARLHGLVAFFFACYGAGTPQRDDFMRNRSMVARSLAEAPFIAALPRRLLSHPNGSALAVFGHVERAWGYSIEPPNVGAQLMPFRNAIYHILSGRPVGLATKDFSDRYSGGSNYLLSHLDTTQPDKKLDEQELVFRWIQRNDARNYVLLGDPAVKLRPDSMG